MNSSIAGVGSNVWLIKRLSKFSTLQANSPSNWAPTTRPLPFNVWKERRTEINAVEFSEFSNHKVR